MDAIIIQEIDPYDESALKQMQTIFESSFRIDERVPWGFMEYDFKRKKRKEGLIHILGAFKGSRLLGFGITFFYWEFTYPSYLAIDKDYRNQGIGTQLLVKMNEIAIKDAKKYKITPIILFEVEKPELAESPAEEEIIFNRIKFYQKFNAIFLDVNYIEPPLLGESLTMYLVMISSPEVKCIKSEALIRYIKVIFKYEYFLNYKKQDQYLKPILDSVGSRKEICGQKPI
ncbi:MAG TPA: GNAT family N-acetyltransferase [Candidatus Deferrimicrobium sp.]|nr:GNAT family N-acetyltransferase [Candidatus Deferrimicrobium sp.]